MRNLRRFTIFVLCLALCACSTFQIIKSGNDDPRAIAEAVCSDLQLTLTAASAMDAWALIYFPNQQALLSEAGTYLQEAEDARSAACSAIALVTDVTTLNELLGKKAQILGLVSKVTALIAQIRGVSSTEIEVELDSFRAAMLREDSGQLSIAWFANNELNGASVGM